MTIRLMAFTLGGLLLAIPALAKECRTAEPNHTGLAVSPTTCASIDKKPPLPSRENRLRAGKNGFIDLGNGTQVRISGRVQVDVGIRR